MAEIGAIGQEPDEEVFLWPCNQVAWDCWLEVQTQWRHGFVGRTGLDYQGVVAYLRAVVGLRGAELRHVMDCIRAAEIAVLVLDSEAREQSSPASPPVEMM